ncbi:hypothetical protein FH972_009942 [Carpinus fangiana]|uniref:Uncharacterized protein n=1 Tax=Carpinus fangiana TaxID=176857 RepID=A0A660KSX1_9ROSI|nr:hypothetical protein FH972_009942 [Carpinus fangiana]
MTSVVGFQVRWWRAGTGEGQGLARAYMRDACDGAPTSVTSLKTALAVIHFESKMASKHMFVCLVCVVLLCLVFMEGTSGLSRSFPSLSLPDRQPNCDGGGHGCFYSKAAASLKTENRKLMAGLKEMKEAVKGVQKGSTTSRNGRSFVGLRQVPSGPDPLHHNGGSPKKPRTP